MSAGLRSGVALRPATSAMEARDALLYLAREHMRCMTSESQTRFEKCVEFVGNGCDAGRMLGDSGSKHIAEAKN